MEDAEKYVAVPVQIFNQLVEYISNKPYNEVATIMSALQDNAKVIEAKSQIEEPTEETQDD